MLPGFTPTVAKQRELFSQFSLVSTRTAPTTSAGGQSNFAAMPAGQPDPRRRLVVILAARTGMDPTDVFIGGVLATFHVGQGRSVPTPDIKVWIYSALVPSGNPDVLAVFPLELVNVSCTMYRFTHVGNPQFATGSNNATTIVASSANMAAGGVLIGGCVQNQGTGSAANWTGLTEQGHFDSGDHSISFGSFISIGAGTRNVSVSGGSTERALVLLSLSP